jgi:two-component system sensor histidine kinase DegS
MAAKSPTRGRRGPPPDDFFRNIPAHLPLILCVYDLSETRAVCLNRPFWEVTGYSPARLQSASGNFLCEILHPDDHPAIERASARFSAAKNGEVIESEFRVRTADGRSPWLHSRFIVISRRTDGSPRLLMVLAEDVTRRHEADTQDLARSQQLEQEQEHLRQLLELNERERRLVAYEIHDGFVQDVVSAQLAIDQMLDRLLKTDPESVPQLLRVRAFVRKAIDESRRLVSELRPSAIDDGGLVEAIEFLVSEAESAHRLQVTFTRPRKFPPLSPLLIRGLVRIVQEALTNVRRHAKTNQAAIRLALIDGRVELQIEDQGVGFDPFRVPAGHYGLEGMRARADAFNGQLTIRSKTGEGTLITAVVPIQPARDGAAAQLPPKRAPRPSAKGRKKRRK